MGEKMSDEKKIKNPMDNPMISGLLKKLLPKDMNIEETIGKGLKEFGDFRIGMELLHEEIEKLKDRVRELENSKMPRVQSGDGK